MLRVWKRGRLVAEGGKILESLSPAAVSELPGLKQTVRTPTPDELKIKLGPDDKYINVIGVVPRQFTTETLTLEPAVIDGCACADPSRRLAKMAVVEKNRGTGRSRSASCTTSRSNAEPSPRRSRTTHTTTPAPAWTTSLCLPRCASSRVCTAA